MNKYLSISLMLLFATTLFAQQKDVSGVVTDSKGKVLKGIRMDVLNTGIHAKSDKKGIFILKQVESEDSVVVYLPKGQESKFRIGDAAKLQLKVKEAIMEVDKGNGTLEAQPLEKRSFDEQPNGSVITAKMIQRNNYQNLKDILRAFISGINIQTGANGETVSNIRGISSLNLSNEPLVIVDGAEMDLNTANLSCSVYDIDRIEVNKEGLGYGVRGANGVIIIKTKR